MSRKHDVNKEIENEVYCGTLPVLPKERKYGFMDALLVLSGYCIATWSYTQGSYLATLVGFKQLLIGAFLAAIFMLMVYQLPVILSVRYGIDIWIWLRSVFGPNGNKIVTIIIIVVNFPWYAVCCELFADSMENLLGLFGIQLFNSDRAARRKYDHMDYKDPCSFAPFGRRSGGHSRIYFRPYGCHMELSA